MFFPHPQFDVKRLPSYNTFKKEQTRTLHQMGLEFASIPATQSSWIIVLSMDQTSILKVLWSFERRDMSSVHQRATLCIETSENCFNATFIN